MIFLKKVRLALIVLVTATVAIALAVSLYKHRKRTETTIKTLTPGAFALSTYLAVDEVAEIIAAKPDGTALVYTNAEAGKIGIIDTSDLDHPQRLESISVRQGEVGEPTSVAITPDGSFAVVAVRMGDNIAQANPGFLRVYDVSDLTNVRHVKDITVGVGPDSVALVGQMATLRAVVAIEDEETTTEGDATIGGARPGRIDVVGLQDLYGGESTGLQSLDLIEAATQAGLAYPQDPQPEFVAIEPSTMKAAVSLQENNGIAIVDLSDATTPKLANVFSTGTVQRNGNADVKKDGEISFTDNFTGRREADAVTWVSSNVVATANEGDTKKDTDGVYPGGRGFTLMDTSGAVVYESGATSEEHARLYGHYPDHRSGDKGVEIEAVATGVFGGSRYLLVGSERGSFVDVYRLDDITAPTYIQFLPTGTSPEGVLAVTGRKDGKQFFVTANEVEGSITFFRFSAEGAKPSAEEPTFIAKDASTPWAAISGLTADDDHIYAVPDDAFSQSRIYTIYPNHVANGEMTITSALLLSSEDGAPLKADLEGIAKVSDGFWLAAEGKTVAENQLIKVSDAGIVTQRISLPKELQNRFADKENATGFEGVAASSDAKKLYVALQRGFDVKKPFAAVLVYDTERQSWLSANYPLDQHSKDAEKYWTGLSEVQITKDGRLLLVERDKGGGKAKAINAEIKRIYSVRVAEIAENVVLKKNLERDLRKDFNYLHEKAEGLVLFRANLWVVNDNDGGGWTRMLNVGKLQNGHYARD